MTAEPAPGLLGERVPAQAVMEEFLALQGLERPRSTLQRVFGVSPLSEETRPWYSGALGEIAVGRILAGLGPDWLVLHAVPVGTGSTDIDHVLVGPGGVFTINTKNHSGQPVWVAGRTLMVAGKKTRHLYNAAHEAARASKLLSAAAGDAVDVTAVVVIVEPKSLTIKVAPEQVTVVTERQLLRWLNAAPPGAGPGTGVPDCGGGQSSPRPGTGTLPSPVTPTQSSKTSLPCGRWWTGPDGGGRRGCSAFPPPGFSCCWPQGRLEAIIHALTGR